MAVHKLKVWSEFMTDLINGNKTFELRFNDRNFQIGDYLSLMEYDKFNKVYLDRLLLVKVTYILGGSSFDAIKKGFVVMSIKRC